MAGKFFIIFTMAFLLWTPSWSCNYKLLESESNTLNSKLTSHISVSQEMIKDSLHFVYDADDVEEKYKQPARFEALYTGIHEAVTDPYFSGFFENYHSIYNDAHSDLKIKASIHLLLEKVSQKYDSLVKLMNRQKKFLAEEKKENVRTTQADADRIFSMFVSDAAIHSH